MSADMRLSRATGWHFNRAVHRRVVMVVRLDDLAADPRPFHRVRSARFRTVCVHAAGAGYAALYCIALAGLTNGECWLGAVLMSPPLVMTTSMAWTLRPK